MEKISYMYAFLARYKYYLVIFFGILFTGIIGENTIYRSIVLQYEIMDLKNEIDQYNKRYNADKEQLRSLERNPKNIERIARERYFMKADDEDIFVLSTDPRNEQNLNIETTTPDETTE